MSTTDFPFEKQRVMDMAGLTKADIKSISQRYPEIIDNEIPNKPRYRLWSLCRALNADLRKLRGQKDLTSVDGNEELVALESIKLKQEQQKLLGLTLKNELILGTTVSKEVARARSLKFINAAKLKMNEFIHLAAGKLPDVRRGVEDLTTLYNRCMGDLWDEAEQIEWTNEGDEQMLQDRAQIACDNDPEFKKIYDKVGRSGSDDA